MRGDFARLTFDPKKHYTGVLHQQGRVWLEADWNEDVYNRQNLLQQEMADIIGACGTPESGTAFKISESTPSINSLDFNIGCGHYYVDGILCQLEGDVTYGTQPDFPDAPLISPPKAGEELRGLVYLEVWQRFITHLEDEALREIALGGPDTAARIKTVAQVKFLPFTDSTQELTCTTASKSIPSSTGKGTLSTIPPEDSQPEDLCRIPDPATYTGRENRLYRVEIHNGGDVLDSTSGSAFRQKLAQDADAGATTLTLQMRLTDGQTGTLRQLNRGRVTLIDDDGSTETVEAIVNDDYMTLTLINGLSQSFTTAKNTIVIGNVARFKWSRDNASFAVSVKPVSDDRKTLTLSSLGRDQATMLHQLDLVEISDDASELGPACGHLTYLDSDPDLDQLIVTLAEALPDTFKLDPSEDRHLTLRRWDGQGWANAKFDATATPDMNLEDGIHIQFGGSNLLPGDYWQFAARSIDGSVENLDGAPPTGIKRHYCPLAIVKWTNQYRFDHSMLLEAFKEIQLSPQQIDHLNRILLTTYGESKPIIADITEILSLAQQVDLSAEQLQGLHELLSRVEPQLMFTVLEDCRSQFPALTELTNLFYVSGDGQEVTPDLTNADDQFLRLKQPLCVGVANGNKLVAGATVQFKIIGDPLLQGVAKGKLRNEGISVNILTEQNGLACCDWQLWFNSSQPAILSQQVEAYLLDDGGHTICLPVRFTANLSVAAEVAYDPPKDCGNLQGATTVQKAIDQLCKTDSGGWSLTGNASTDPSKNFLGTTDEKPLVIKTHAKEAMRVDPTGKVGIGITQPDAMLQVNSGEAGPTLPQIHITGDHAGLLKRTPAILRLTDSGMYLLAIPPHPPEYTPGISWDIRADGYLHFFASERNVMNLTTDGKVGIGTTPNAVYATLQVSSAGDSDVPQVYITQNTAAERARLRFNSCIENPDTHEIDQGVPWDIAVDWSNMYFSLPPTQPHGSTTDVMTLRADGSIEVPGGKHFIQTHPNNPAKEIVYTSLEGGEAGTYIRGTGKLENGKAVIDLPEHFSLVTSEDGLTVQLTPRGEWLQLYVVQVGTKQIIVQEAQGKSGQFDYLIQGVRKGYEHHEVIREKK